MGILDDAIKEHLELKRQHGAGEDELKQLEDEAFGAAERPGAEGSASDVLAEAPTEFMAQPEVEEPPGGRPPPTDIAGLQEAPPAEPEPPEPSAGPSTEEREAIAEQPTEMYDVDEELSGSESPAPTEDELVEEEMGEPRLAPVDPLSGVDDAEDEPEPEQDADDFFDEKRLSDELDQALEAPVEDEEDAEPALSPEEGVEDEDKPEAEVPPAEHHEEDVLEETPDFLEEAPEDDQLWFEQKPPKDFNFDD
jgi:hypothetical protein